MADNQLSATLRRELAKYPGLDARAVLAVAAQEGLSGRIGDGGHAYGPFQLNNAGGVITRTHPGTNDPRIQQWASSPDGINYALGQISHVAGGLKGRAAVQAIVSKFERPANPGREIARAFDLYGQPVPAAGPAPLAAAAAGSPTPSPAAAPPRDFRPQLASQLASAAASPTNDLTGFYGTLRQAIAAKSSSSSTPAVAKQAVAQLPRTQVGAAIAKTAISQIGIPYQWGGPAKLGSRTDCSGLLQASAAAHGVKIGRTTYEQYKQGIPVSLDQLEQGDGVFFRMGKSGPEHVGIYIGGGKIVEDPHTGATVHISELAGRGAVGARRFA